MKKKIALSLVLSAGLYAGYDTIRARTTPLINTSNSATAGEVFQQKNDQVEAEVKRIQRADVKGVYLNTHEASSTIITLQQPSTPPAPIESASPVFKFNQFDGREREFRAGLVELAKRAGGRMVIESGSLYSSYQFKGIKKTITWKICNTNGYCRQLPTMSPSNEGSYKFSIHFNQENGTDKDGIKIFKKHGSHYGDLRQYRRAVGWTGAVDKNGLAGVTEDYGDGSWEQHFTRYTPDDIIYMQTTPRYYEATIQ